MTARRRRDRREPVVVVTAADERYLLPLAVMVRSLTDNFDRRRRRLVLHVLDGGIPAAGKRKALASWDLAGCELHWVRPRCAHLGRLVVSERFGLAAHLRLLIPSLLPASVDRALYLDADTLVLDDVGGLWATDLQGHPLGAVQDPHYRTVAEVLPNHHELGIPPRAKYFNSGVLVMDLALWRAEGITGKVMDYLEAHKDTVRYPDQDALNAVLAGRWLELSPRWNAVLEVLWHRRRAGTPQERRAGAEGVENPAVLHFLVGPKPWQQGAFHHRRFLFFHYLDRTRWAGWRPPQEPPAERPRRR